MILKELKKSDLTKFIDFLMKDYKVIAPVKKKKFHAFEIITDSKQVDLTHHNTVYPFNKFFFPKYEEIFSFKKNKIKVDYSRKKRVLFGLRACDSNALLVLDKIFLGSIDEPYYKMRRENTLIIVLECVSTEINCFCESMGTNKAKEYDLFFADEKDCYLVKAGSEEGEKLLRNSLFKKTNRKITNKKLKFNKKLKKKNIKKMDKNFNSKIWEEYSKKCLSCCACTITCPTCSCFSIDDNFDAIKEEGKRVRTWTSCQNPDYSKVAGGYVFRRERGTRAKHRIYCKLRYFKENFKIYGCVGCGRCLNNCPTKMDFTEVINRLK